ncbi:MAG TPA: hypothetical protein VK843_10680 [Planctomycetota bacterium]|nr:hypothetical protein [Planctomycetota bacterium]
MASHAYESARKIGALAEQVRLDPRDTVGWRELASAWLHLGQCDPASSCVDALIAIEPQAASTMLLRAELLAAQENLGMAQVWAERAVSADPGSAEARLTLGSILDSSGEKPRGLVETNKARELEPEECRFALRLARSLRDLGRIEEALDLEDEAMERASASGDRAALGQCVLHSSFALGQSTRAEFASLKRRLAGSPEHLALRLRWAVCACDAECRPSKSEGEAAREYLVNLIRSRPDLPGLPDICREVLQESGEPGFSPLAVDHAWNAALAERSADLNVIANAATYYFDSDRRVEAERWIERASQLDPNESRWHAMRGGLLLSDREPAGRIERARSAIAHLGRAAELERLPSGDSPELAMALGYACCACARLDDATSWIERARRSEWPRDRWNSIESVHLLQTVSGLIAFARGDRVAARESLRASVDLPLPAEFEIVQIQMELADPFLRAGEKDLVIEFLGRAIRVSDEAEHEILRTDRRIVDDGRVPMGWDPMTLPFRLLGRH